MVRAKGRARREPLAGRRLDQRHRRRRHPRRPRLAQAAVRRCRHPGHARRRAVWLCHHELRRRQLERHVQAGAPDAAAGDAVGLLRRSGVAVQAPAADVRASGRAGRHRRVRRQHHADLADVSHGGQPARRRAAVGARRPARGSAGAIRCRAGHHLRADRGVDLVGALAQQQRTLRLPGDVGRCRGYRGVDALAAGPASRCGRPDHLAGADRVLHPRPARALAGGADRNPAGRGRHGGPPGDRSTCTGFRRRFRLRHRHRLRGAVHHAVCRLALVLQRRTRRLARAAGAAGGDLHHRPARRHAVGAEDRQHGGAVARLRRLRPRGFQPACHDDRHAAQYLAILPGVGDDRQRLRLCRLPTAPAQGAGSGVAA